MRQRALRLLLLGPHSRFWWHVTHAAWITGQRGLHASSTGAGIKIENSAFAEDAGDNTTRPFVHTDMVKPVSPLRPPMQQRAADATDSTTVEDVAASIPLGLCLRSTYCLRPAALLPPFRVRCRTASSWAPRSRSPIGAAQPPWTSARTVRAVIETPIGCPAYAHPAGGVAAAIVRASETRELVPAESQSISRDKWCRDCTASSASGQRPRKRVREQRVYDGIDRHAKSRPIASVELRVGHKPASAGGTAVGSATDFRSTARDGSASSGRLLCSSESLQNQLDDILDSARQAVRSRDTQRRRKAAARLRSWLCQGPSKALEHAARAATSVGPLLELPASAVPEIAGLCCDLLITDRTVWDRLLQAVAREAAAAASSTGYPEAKEYKPGPTDLPALTTSTSGSFHHASNDKRLAYVVQAWEYALVVRAAAACGQPVAQFSQLYVLEQALSTLVHRCLLPVPTHNGRPDGESPLLQATRLDSPGRGQQQGCDGPDGVLGLAALLHVSGELTPISGEGQTPWQHAPKPEYLMTEPVPAAAAAARVQAILAQSGVLEGALRKLLAVGQQIPFAGGAIVTQSTVGAASSLRAILLAWCLLNGGTQRPVLSAISLPKRPPAALEPPAGSGRVAAAIINMPTAADAPRSSAGLDLELLQQLGQFVRGKANLLLPDARSDGGAGSDGCNSGGDGNSGGNLRAIQQLSLAWRSGPDLRRHFGLSRAVWDALSIAAELAVPGVPWVSCEPTSAANDACTYGASSMPASTASLLALSGPVASADGTLLLSELCRLAAATFYSRTDPSDSATAAESGTSAYIHGTRSSNNNSTLSSSANGSYSPSSDDLLMLVRTVEALRCRPVPLVTAPAAAASVSTFPTMDAEFLTAGAVASLEAIVQAASSAHLRRVTGLLLRERQPSGTDAFAIAETGDGKEVLKLPTSSLLAEYLARRSRIPDWHLIWRLMRHHYVAAVSISVAVAELVPPAALHLDAYAGREAAAASALTSRVTDVAAPAASAAAWAAHASAAAAERVLCSTDEELRKWCWPLTAVRLAGTLAETLRLETPEVHSALGGVVSHAIDRPLLPEVMVSAAERLLLHAAPTNLAASVSDLAAALSWLRSAAILGGGRHHHGIETNNDGPFSVALTKMGAHAEVLVKELKLQQLEHHETASEAAMATDTGITPVWTPDVQTNVYSLSSARKERGTTTTVVRSSSAGRAILNNSTDHYQGNSNGLGAARVKSGTGEGLANELQAVGQLLEADAQVPEGYLPSSLLEGCLEALAAAAVVGDNIPLVMMERQKQLKPWEGPLQGAEGRVGSAGGAEGCSDIREVLGRAAAQALTWLAHRQLLPDAQLLSPLLKAVIAPVSDGVAPGGDGANGEELSGVRAGKLKEGVPKQKLQQQQLPHLAAATLSVASLAELAAAEGVQHLASQLHDAARRLASSLQRATPDRLTLPQVAALCDLLRRLGLMDASLLLHLTECQRQQQEQQRQCQGAKWRFPAATAGMYTAMSDSCGGSGTAAIAACRLLQTAGAVLCPGLLASHLVPDLSGGQDLGSADATVMPLGSLQSSKGPHSLGSWLSSVLCRAVELVPPQQLVAAWYAAIDLAAVANVGGRVDEAGRGSTRGDGGAVREETSSESWLHELSAGATRRLLSTGIDDLLLHQLAALSRCLAEPAAFPHPCKDVKPYHDECSQPKASGVPRYETIDVPKPPTAAPGVPKPLTPFGEMDVDRTAGWLPRWLKPQRPAQRSQNSCSKPDGSGRLLGGNDDVMTGEAPMAEVAEWPQKPASTSTHNLRSEVQAELPASELHQRRARLQEQVQEGLLHRTMRHGDAYEAPADMVCCALHDLALSGALRASPLLAASLVDGLVFRLADDASIEGLHVVTAALAAGGADPWVALCAGRGLLDELATGLQRRLRLQPEEVKTGHLTAMAENIYHLATVISGAGAAEATTTTSQLQANAGIRGAATAAAALPSSGIVLRVLSRALAARAEQLSPEQALHVAAMFSVPPLRDTHLLQRLTAAAAAVPPPVTALVATSERAYTADQLLQMAQCLYSAGLRDQRLFVPLAGALRARADIRSTAGEGSNYGCRSGGSGGVDARTLQAAAALLRAVKLNADADAFQQAFVAQMRTSGPSKAA